MDSQKTRIAALMAIRPRYAAHILAGEKRVEFRKRPFRSTVSHVVIYATAPVQRIVGFFEVAGIEEAAPLELWDRYGETGCIDERDFRAYYKDHSTGVAIRVGRVFRLGRPLPLAVIGRPAAVPQSFRYLTTRKLNSLSRRVSSDVEARSR